MRWTKNSLEIRAEWKKFALQMQQDAKAHWVYEWPMKRKRKVASQEIVGQKTVKAIEKWMRYVENPQRPRESGSCV
jgi:ribosomal protein L35